MRRIIFAAPALVLCLLPAGCLSYRETPSRHVIHRGEDGVLVSGSQTQEVYVGATGQVAHQLAKALDANDRNRIGELVSKGEAFAVPAGVRVHVASEHYNERRIRILEGEHEGKEGWVPFEWLKPAPRR